MPRRTEKQADETKERGLILKCSEEERADWSEAAQLAELSLNEWMRRTLNVEATHQVVVHARAQRRQRGR